MSRGFSLYLDALRFGAALVVALSHLAYPRFTEGRWIWIRELNLGSDAVVIFFVLSGLVISHSVSREGIGPGRYAFDRITRLVSVAAPALALGFALDRLGAARAPELYAGWWYAPLPLWEQLLRGLSFSSEWAGLQARLGTNGPFWSLSYEAAYYALFGIAVFARGARRWALLAAGAMIVGINVLLLAPCWLLGVWVQRRIMAGRLPTGGSAAALALAPAALYALALAVDVPGALSLGRAALAWELRFSDEVLWNSLLAVLVAAHLAGMAGLLAKAGAGRGEAAIRWLAGGSFSLYLMHYPLLQALAALGLSGPGLGHDLLLLGSTCALCFAFAALFERPLGRWRALASALLRPRTPSRAGGTPGA